MSATPIAPHGRITILFTDIENSTPMKRAPGIGPDVYQREMLDPHFACLHKAIRQYSGYPVGTPAGDSIMVVFQDPGEAMACAKDMQRNLASKALSRIDATGKEWQLTVRIGVHTAERQYRPDCYGGPDADYAARVMSLGKGGQILVSETTFKEALNREQYTLYRWPGRYLKGIGGLGETVYEMLWYEGQTAQEPGSRQLPHWCLGEPNKFIGRAELMAQIGTWIEKHHAPLLTLQGPGGVGKTRLAVEAALSQASLFAAGTAFVALDHVIGGEPAQCTPAQLAVAIIKAVGAPAEILRNPEVKLISYLRSLLSPAMHMLILLDNWECASNPQTLEWLGKLATIHGLRCLVTSRIPMGLPHIGESLDVAGMAIPEHVSDVFESFEGYQLFAERVLQRAPNAALNDRAAILRILDATEGFALAIELVAARIVDYQQHLGEVASGLASSPLKWQRTCVELGDTRKGTNRHQSMEACLQWSLRLLPRKEQVAFMRLSLFAAGFDANTAEALFSIPKDWLLRWRRYYLIEESNAQGTTRYALLPIVREFARMRLQRSLGALFCWRYIGCLRRFVAHYANLAVAREQADGPAKKTMLDTEWRNILEAADLAYAIRDAGAIDVISEGMNDYLLISTYGPEALRLHEMARQMAKRCRNVSSEAHCALRFANMALRRSDHETARQSYEQALVLFRQTGDLSGEAYCLVGLGEIACRHAQDELAEELFGRALPLFSVAEDVRGKANCIFSLGDLALNRSRHEAAGALYEQAYSLFQQLKDARREACCLQRFGDIAFARYQHEVALEHYKQALLLYRQVGSVLGEAICCQRFGDIALLHCEYEDARNQYEQALSMYRQVVDVLGEANCIYGLGEIALDSSELDKARQHFEQAMPLYHQIDHVLSEANCNYALGELARRCGDNVAARRHYEQALSVYQQVGDVLGEANCNKGLGTVELHRRDYGQAREHYRVARQLYQQISDVMGEANCACSFGEVALCVGDYLGAHEYYVEAMSLYRLVRRPTGEADCLLRLGDIALFASDGYGQAVRWAQVLPILRQFEDLLGQVAPNLEAHHLPVPSLSGDAPTLYCNALRIYEKNKCPVAEAIAHLRLALVSSDYPSRQEHFAAACVRWTIPRFAQLIGALDAALEERANDET